jgi:hypothetical protein
MSKVDIRVLKRHGITAGNYKRIFSAKSAERPTRVNKLIQIIADRTKDGREMNLRDYRTYWAIDEAFNAPFQQVTPTLMKSFLDRKWKNADEAFKAMEAWGLNERDLFQDVKLEDGTAAKMLNPPFLYQIVVPIVKAYFTIRLAKIFNERDTNPLLPYTPLKLTERNLVLCEVMTDVVNTIATRYGYSSVMRESIQQMLKYGISLSFPREAWHTEEQESFDDFNDETGKGKNVITKEGIRYYFPHPTRMFYDLLHPLTTFNTDTGCEYAGYWHVMRYGDVLDNGDYWNRESVWYGTNWFDSPLASNYFTEVYPCQLKFPDAPAASKDSREDRAAYYSTSTRDKAIFVTEFFMKLVPKDWGLGEYEDSTLKKLTKTYNNPVWHRFVIAGDDTIIYAEPLPYTPVWFMGYDYDPQCARTSSLALEAIPWQDEVGNILSQIILTSKQNLANVMFYDKVVINSSDIRNLQNSGSKQFVSMNFIGIDSMKLSRQGVDAKQAIYPVQLNKQNIQELFQMLSSTLNMLERVLQITAQETGASASHQQSKAEIIETGGASTNRLAFTSSFVDEGIDAWQRQLHDAFQSYGQDDIEAEVNPETEKLDDVLKELGFTVKSRSDNSVFVSGQKKSLHTLRLEAFARRNSGPQNGEDSEMAKVMFSLIQTVAGQPELLKKVGAKNLMVLLEEATRLGGGRKDFHIPMLKDSEKDDEVPANILEAIKAAQEATLKTIEEKALQPIAKEIGQEQQKLSQLEQMVQQLEGIYKVAQANQQKAAIKIAEAKQKMQIRAAETQAAEHRKDAVTAAAIQRDARKSQAEIAIQAHKSGAETAIATAETHAKTAVHAHSKGVETAAKIQQLKKTAVAKSGDNKS